MHKQSRTDKLRLPEKIMFLQKISQDIIKAHGRNLAKVAVIFPNKRASLWMNDFLLEAAAGAPVFSPQYFSISEFFQMQSRLSLADHIQLVSILHKSYCKITGEKQTLDQFYAWGETLLADFDNVDKSLADAEQLFINIGNYHEMDSIDFLTDHQKELLQHFFHSFTRNQESVIQQKFISLWNNLLAIYTDFKEQLTALGIAYEGMLYRDVVENASYEDFPLEKYYAVGFNQLLKCEEKLFLTLADKIRIQNDDATIRTVCPDAKITIAQTLTDDLQARYIETWLNENGRIEAGRKTAIVLCDEHLLPSAIYGLPSNVGPVNITAGFPLAESQPASYIATLLELYTEGLSKDGSHYRLSYLRNLHGHPLYKYAKPVSEDSVIELNTNVILDNLEAAIMTIATESSNPQNDQSSNQQNDQSSNSQNEKTSNAQLLSEATFRVYNIITRLKSLNSEGFLDIEPLTLSRLYKQILLSATIPFHGEPAKGIQIMGVLETRNLDFDHLLMLSCNEGCMPQGSSDISTIPYAMKKAFELNTSDDRTSIFAYYFYRLLKRCKDVTLVYNASSNDTSPGEMSRFLLNLIVNNSAQINRLSLQTDFHSKTLYPQPADSTEDELRDYIEKRQKKGLSPTAINTFLRCQKRFYYEYYKELRNENDEEDTMDDAAFGTFFHNAAEAFYGKFIGENITSGMLEEYIKKPALLEPIINYALKKTQEELYGANVVMETGGVEHLLKKIVLQYLVRLIKNDMTFCPFKIVSLEQRYYKRYAVSTPFGDTTVSVGGAVDRLDQINDGEERLRVVDYKTGKDHTDDGKKIVAVEDMFDNDKEGSDYYRQTCIYSIALAENNKENPRHLPVAPSLLFIRNKAVGNAGEKYDPILKLGEEKISSIADIREDYEIQLQQVLNKIFSTTHFSITDDLNNCNFCPFAELCKE